MSRCAHSDEHEGAWHGPFEDLLETIYQQVVFHLSRWLNPDGGGVRRTRKGGARCLVRGSERSGVRRVV